MILDMCSRTSEWYDARRTADQGGVGGSTGSTGSTGSAGDAGDLVERYVRAALRLAGAT